MEVGGSSCGALNSRLGRNMMRKETRYPSLMINHWVTCTIHVRYNKGEPRQKMHRAALGIT